MTRGHSRGVTQKQGTWAAHLTPLRNEIAKEQTSTLTSETTEALNSEIQANSFTDGV